MAGDDAKIKVGADVSDVKAAAGEAKKVWAGVGQDIIASVGSSLQGIARDLAGVATAQAKINFSSQHQQVREFEASTARLAVATHSSLEAMRADYESIGVATGKRPQEVALWATEVGRLTYNVKGAGEGFKGISALASMTGRLPEDYRGLAVQLGTVGKVSGDTTQAIGTLVAQAQKIGTVGGPAAFIDQVEAMGDTFSHFTRNTTADYLKLTALQGELGKGLEPAAAARVAQGAFGAISADPLRWSRYLHRDILNKETGQVDDPAAVMRDITARAKRDWGGDALRLMRLNFGAEVGTRMFNADYEGAAKSAGLKPSVEPQAAQAAYLATDAGKREVANAELAKASRDLFGSSTALGKAADSLQQFASAHPLLSTTGAGVAGGIMGTLTSTLGTSLTKAMAKGGVSGAAKMLAGGGLQGLAIAGAGLVGLAAGGGIGYGLNYLTNKIEDKYKVDLNPFGQYSKGDFAAKDAKIDELKKRRDQVRAARSVLGFASQAGLVSLPGEAGAVAERAAAGRASNEELAQAITKAILDGFKNMTIVNGADGPVELTKQATTSAAAGRQG